MHSVIVTGYTGFIGSNFLKYDKELNINCVDLINHKIEDIEFCKALAVLHLAALVHQMKGAPEEDYFKVNRDLAYNVAKKAKAEGVKHFIFMSTAKVFGETNNGRIVWDENSECHPTDPYGKSKYEAEKLLIGLQDENFKVAIVRSPLVYGAGVKANMYNLVKLVNTFPILPFEAVNNLRSMVYVGNLVELLKHIILTQSSGIFIAGDRKPLSTTQLVLLISKASNKEISLFKIPPFLLRVINLFNPSLTDRLFGSLVIDNTYTNEKLNFDPPFSSEEGINEMVRWYKNDQQDIHLLRFCIRKPL